MHGARCIAHPAGIQTHIDDRGLHFRQAPAVARVEQETPLGTESVLTEIPLGAAGRFAAFDDVVTLTVRAADGDESHGPFLPMRSYEDEAQCDIHLSPSPLLKHYHFLYHRCYIGIAGRLAREKAGLQAHGGAIEVDTLYEDAMEMEVHIERAAKTLEKRDRARVDGGSRVTALDHLVDVILPNCRADDGMDLGGELVGCRHPVAQGDGHRDDPLSCRDPGEDLLDEVRRRLGHPPGCTRRAKPAPLAT